MEGAGVEKPETAAGEARRAAAKRYRNLPNQITLSRLVLSVVFFLLIILTNHGYFGASRSLVLNLSIGLFILTAVTDFLDGYIARRLEIVSNFGRISDPIVDKVLICGSFVLLVETCELVRAWFPVIILTREFLISGLRSFLESRGIPFGAGLSGKIKMGLQSVTIPVVLFYEANGDGSAFWKWSAIALLAATALLTVTSSIDYVVRACRLFGGRASSSGEEK